MKLQGKVCIVTGAARGIGRGIGLRLVADGASVVFADLNRDQAEESAAEARAQGGAAVSAPVDVVDRKQVQAMVAQTVSEFGKLDVIFNNAGINKPQRFLETTEDNWDRIMRVNGLGVLIGTQEAAKQMIAQGTGGKIINTASIVGRQGYANIVPYCASKSAVIMITQGAAHALAEHGITVNGFSPGVVDTPLWEQLDEDLMEIGDSSEPGEAMRDFSASILLGRVSTPDDITGLASFLASSDSDFITGQVINVEGGMQMV
ncbi:MAG: glucose 1-dehydrogenase [Caldilineaceae bacterium]|nr:glucose 1-dehydrogenase [Caldilineaceae bacterium]